MSKVPKLTDAQINFINDEPLSSQALFYITLNQLPMMSEDHKNELIKTLMLACYSKQRMLQNIMAQKLIGDEALNYYV